MWNISDHIVVVRRHVFTFFRRSCFQSVIRVISSASLSLIFIWWLSWVPVSTSITMSLSVNSYKHAFRRISRVVWKPTANCRATTPPFLFRIMVPLVQTYNLDIVWHVLHLVALGHILQQRCGDLPHLLVIGILQLSTLCKCGRRSRELLAAKFISTTWNKSQWPDGGRVPSFFLFLFFFVACRWV